jgi:tetratricopeptide (TPR) repeat protein
MSQNDFSGVGENIVQAQQVGDIHFTREPLRPLPRPQQLPLAPAGFLDRNDEISALDGFLASAEQPDRERPTVAVITGMGGVGKTSLAVCWAWRVRERFPDGFLFANLHGYDRMSPANPHRIMDSFLRALDIPLSKLPTDPDELTGLYRSVLHGRRLLIILDNVRITEQARPLLGPSSCTVLVTSRSSLPGLVVHEGAARLVLRPLPPAQAVQLLADAVGRPLTSGESQAATALARQCAYLPLALRIVAERVASSSEEMLVQLTDEIRTERDHLGALRVPIAGESTEVRSVFSWSYQDLPADAARMFRLLGLHAGPTISLAAAAALVDAPVAQARDQLAVLADLNMLERVSGNRYRFHDLVRAYAVERCEAEEALADRSKAGARLASWYLVTADAADRQLAPLRRHVPLTPADAAVGGLVFRGYDEALDWCEAEHENLVAVIRSAAAEGRHSQAWKLAMTLVNFFNVRKYREDRLITARIAAESARSIGDLQGEAWSTMNVGSALADLGQSDEAMRHYRESLGKWHLIDDSYGQAMCLNNLSEAQRYTRRFDDSLESAEHAIVLCRALADRRSEAITLTNFGMTYSSLGRFSEALDALEQGLEAAHGIDRYQEGVLLSETGRCLTRTGQFQEAAERFNDALLCQRETGDTFGEARSLVGLAGIQRELHDLNGARDSLNRAFAIFSRLREPEAVAVQTQIDQLRQAEGGSG